jgi:hypothetical protein
MNGHDTKKKITTTFYALGNIILSNSQKPSKKPGIGSGISCCTVTSNNHKTAPKTMFRQCVFAPYLLFLPTIKKSRLECLQKTVHKYYETIAHGPDKTVALPRFMLRFNATVA